MKNLPKDIEKILEEADAPCRLKRHLQIVYYVASGLLDQLNNEWPNLNINRKAILFGAATHDIGKIEVLEEIYSSGNQHEKKGLQLLTKLGYPDILARFAWSHGNWRDKDMKLEDLLVSLSDVIWNGIRLHELEELIVKKIAVCIKRDFWEVYPKLDAIITKIIIGADDRLLFQGE